MNLKKLYNKYKDVIPYLFFGVCTTVINVVVYWLMAHPFGMGTTISTLIAWLVAVIFAYVTNRKWVFHSKAKGRKEILEEIGSFFACRIGTGIVDWVIMLLFVDLIGFNDVIIKFLANVIVIILNYIASKFIIFNTKNTFFLRLINYLKKNKTKLILNVLIFWFLLLITFIFLFKSPLHPWVESDSGVDSSVFKSIAIMMDNGLMPYRDTFDHKGPLMYIINFIGYKLGGYCGIWYIEFISLFISLIIVYKISRFKCNKSSSLFVVFLFLAVLYNFIEDGNFIEEYCIPFICGSLYIFLDYLLHDKVTNLRLILCGLSFGAVLMLRPNTIALWIVFCLVILIKCLYEKKYKHLFKFIFYFAIGISIIVVPLVLWLYLNDSLLAFWECYIIFNFSYTNSLMNNYISYYRIVTFFTFINDILILLSIILSIVVFFYKKDKVIIYNLLFTFLSLLFISISGVEFPHYGMLLVPCIIYPFSCFFELNIKNKFFVFLSYSYLCIIVGFMWLDVFMYFPRLSFNGGDNISKDVRYITNFIKENTDKNNKISVYGNWNIIYILSERFPASRYSYQIPINKIDENITEYHFNELKEYLPKYIVVDKESYDSDLWDFILENNYELVWQSDNSLYTSSSIFVLKNSNDL